MQQPLDAKNDNVCTEIVPNDLCIGCGICTAVCPPQVLKMVFSDDAEYIPLEYKEGCLPKCNLCLRACPFWDQPDNEDTMGERLFAGHAEMQKDNTAGYHHALFAGHVVDLDTRLRGASGGLATWLLQQALEHDVVDAVVSVRAKQDPNCLFEFAMFETSEALQQAAGSIYYPVEMSSVIYQIIHGPEKRYAIVGLPCFIKAVRLAMRTNRRLRRRIIFIAGLVCGQTKSKFFAEYLSAASSNGASHELQKVDFRVKDLDQPSSNFMLRFEHKAPDGDTHTVQYHRRDKLLQSWNKRYFAPNDCSYCDDVFAELADVSFMDAWLPEYLSDSKGSNLVIVRNPDLLPLFEQGQQQGAIVMAPVTIEQVIKSQAGVIHFKQGLLPQRLKLASDRGGVVPQKRVSPASSVATLDKWLLDLYQGFMVSSKAYWKRHSNDVDAFHEQMQGLERRYGLYQKLMLLKILPGRILVKLKLRKR